MLGRLYPTTGVVTDVSLPAGSRPRRMATGPDGTIWVTLYGSNRLVQLDPATAKIVKEHRLPAGSGGGAYAVTVDAAGIVWANEIATDTVLRFDPKSGELRVVQLPSKGVGIRKMIVDGAGRLWYMGSHWGWSNEADPTRTADRCMSCCRPRDGRRGAVGATETGRPCGTHPPRLDRVPGIGDPPGFKLLDCATQRNLSEAGRAEAHSLGVAFRARGTPVSEVLSSQWCRCMATATLAFGQATAWPALNSSFNETTRASNDKLAEVKARLAQPVGGGNLILVIHHVNIRDLTGIAPAQAEMVVVKPLDQGHRLVGRMVASAPPPSGGR